MKRASSQAGLTVGEREREGGVTRMEREGGIFDVFHLNLTTKQRKNKLKLL